MMNDIFKGICFLGSILVLAVAGHQAYIYKHRLQEKISVVGSASESFTSDLIVWRADFSRKSLDLKKAYVQIKIDEQQIKTYLTSKGLPPDAAVFSAIKSYEEFDYPTDNNGRSLPKIFTGHRLQQDFIVESTDIAKVEAVSRAITELLEKGIAIHSQAPDYYYTELDRLKIDLLAKASTDGYARAKAIASKAKSKVRRLGQATQGVFQITGQNLNEDYAYGGTFNTSSKHKTATITVKMRFDLR